MKLHLSLGNTAEKVLMSCGCCFKINPFELGGYLFPSLQICLHDKQLLLCLQYSRNFIDVFVSKCIRKCLSAYDVKMFDLGVSIYGACKGTRGEKNALKRFLHTQDCIVWKFGSKMEV